MAFDIVFDTVHCVLRAVNIFIRDIRLLVWRFFESFRSKFFFFFLNSFHINFEDDFSACEVSFSFSILKRRIS